MSALSEKIWITRKTRIYTEQRLLNKSLITQAVMIFYSFFLVAFSLWNLIQPNNHLEIYSIVSSIAVLVSSIFISSQRFSERAMMIRNCYISLDELYSKVLRIEQIGNKDKIEQIESEYTNILLNVENHSDYDYLSLRYSLRNNRNTTLPKFTFKDCVDYFISKIYRILLTMIIITLPFIMSFITITVVKYVSLY